MNIYLTLGGLSFWFSLLSQQDRIPTWASLVVGWGEAEYGAMWLRRKLYMANEWELVTRPSRIMWVHP